MNNLAVMRCDASPEAGTGHVMRCMALAEELERLGFEPVFVISKGTVETVPALAAKKWRLIEAAGAAESEQAKAIDRALPGHAALLVADHYNLGKEFELATCKFTDRIAVLEDKTSRAHECDLLINSNAGLTDLIYRPRFVSDACRILLGPKYAPLRAEFSELRDTALERRKGEIVKRVLVSFGGSDPANGTGLALAALEQISPRPKIDVAIGSAATAIKDLQNRYGNIAAFHVGTNKMAELMCAADLAIGGGGSTAWERAALGLPTILVTIADNQRDIAQALHGAGAAIDLGEVKSVSAERLRKTIEEVRDDPAWLIKMAAAASGLTDGHGARRIAIALSGNEIAKGDARIQLRRVEPEDQNLVLNWQREPNARRHSRNPKPPTEQEHSHWFPAAVNDPNRVFAIVLCNGEACGFVRLDGKAQSNYEVNLLVAASHQKRGIGVAALKLARKCVPSAAFDASILPENKASVAAFTKAGYTHAADDLMRSVPA